MSGNIRFLADNFDRLIAEKDEAGNSLEGYVLLGDMQLTLKETEIGGLSPEYPIGVGV